MTRHKPDSLAKHKKELLEDADHDFDEASEEVSGWPGQAQCLVPIR
jgi:hypothetical protein